LKKFFHIEQKHTKIKKISRRTLHLTAPRSRVILQSDRKVALIISEVLNIKRKVALIISAVLCLG